MNTDLISYSFDAEEWTSDSQLMDFSELAYPDGLSEFAYGDIALTDEQDHSKCLHLSEVELGYLALNLHFHASRLAQGAAQKATIASMYQHFEIEIIAEAGKTCIIRLVDEPEKHISMQFDTFLKQTHTLLQNIWKDMLEFFPNLSVMEDYEQMAEAFNPNLP